jgi:hypothetical protein
MILYQVDGNNIVVANVTYWREAPKGRTLIQFVGSEDNYILVNKPVEEVSKDILALASGETA